jgi:hypothetical protein
LARGGPRFSTHCGAFASGLRETAYAFKFARRTSCFCRANRAPVRPLGRAAGAPARWPPTGRRSARQTGAHTLTGPASFELHGAVLCCIVCGISGNCAVRCLRCTRRRSSRPAGWCAFGHAWNFVSLYSLWRLDNIVFISIYVMLLPLNTFPLLPRGPAGHRRSF